MNIVLVTDTFLPRLGGIELHVRDLGVRLVAAGHRVSVLTMSGHGAEELPIDGGIGGLTVHRLARAGSGILSTAIGRLAARDTLQHLLADADVVHVHSSVLSPFAWQAAALSSKIGLPTVITVHSVLPHSSAVPMATALRRATAAGLRWTAVSEVVAGSLRPAVGVPVHVLHNGIDPSPWVPAAGMRVGPREGFTVVSALRFTARKRPRALVAILDGLRDLVPAEVPVRAVLVGDGPLLRETRRRVESRGMGDWVEFRGRTDRIELARTYARADAYLAPARRESFGLAVLEARCSGLPTVAMAGSGVEEFVRHGVEGFLARSDAHAAHLLANLARDPLLRQRIRHHNTTTEPEVTWSHVLPQTLEEYHVAGAKRVRPSVAVELTA